MLTPTTIHEALTHLTTTIRQLEQKYHRPPNSVTLLAVTKAQPLTTIQLAIAAGHHIFGENYLQEALPKIAAYPQLEWHFIGSIQSNKTRHIAEYFAWAHTVTSQKIAQRLNDQRPTHLPPLNICIAVNVSNENSKSGITDHNELIKIAEYCRQLPRIKLRGLMTIPAPQTSFDKQRAEFHKLKVLQEELGLDTLSMGMTDDLAAAIAEGATIVRVGRGIFGRG